MKTGAQQIADERERQIAVENTILRAKLADAQERNQLLAAAVVEWSEENVRLRAQLAAARAATDRLRVALGFYANPQTYGLHGGHIELIFQDVGARAKRALAEGEK